MAQSTGTFSAVNDAVELTLDGGPHVIVFISGSFTGLNVRFQGWNDQLAEWFDTNLSVARPPKAGDPSTATQTSLISSSVTYSYFAQHVPYTKLRALCAALASGTPRIDMESRAVGNVAIFGTAEVLEAVDISGFEGAVLSFNTSADQTDVLEAGIYDVVSNIDCSIKVGSTADDFTFDEGYHLLARNVVPARVHAGERIGAVSASISGELRYHKVHA